ncbi:tectonic [Aedes albopictus]|uniref:Tectonic domain-containing protein n=1 Tax=Aedes albopictus TaxID=7160 RepID=A0ABM1XZJ8_AEDAL
MQKFVKIDVSKINQKENNETTAATPGNTTVEGTTTSPSTSQTTPAVTKGEENATTSSTTPTTTATVQPASTTTEIAPFEQPKEGRLTKKVPSGYYCKCDLKINICDVNCCCDIDCSEEILRTFVCDEEQLDIGEYHHQEGLQSCEVQGGLFCLVGERRDATRDMFYDTNLKEIASKRRWNDIFPLDLNPKDKAAAFYRVNDVLKFYNETSEKVEPFTLPQSLTNSECQIMQPVRFLQDQSTECLRSSLDELEAFTSTLIEQQPHLRYLRLPKAEIMEHCMDQDCFNSSIQFCNLAGRNCRETNTSESNEDELEGEPWYCPQVNFEFQHNYTHLEGLNIRLFCGQMELADKIWTKLVVKFARKNEDKFARSVSGNLGYLQGKPLIVSSVQIPENDTAEDRRTKKYMLSYFTNGTRLPDDSFRMKLPKSRRNRCVTEDRSAILFGEDSWNKCNFSPQLNVTDGSNFTEVCKSLQTGIDEILLHGIRPKLQEKSFDEVNWFASMYGNPVNRSSEWIQFRTVNVFNEEVSGSGSSNKSYFTCHNMVINVRYQFFHGLATVRNVPRQHVLREAEIVFGPRVNLQFALEEDIRVPVFVQVQFFDLTSGGINSGSLEIKGVSIWTISTQHRLVVPVELQSSPASTQIVPTIQDVDEAAYETAEENSETKMQMSSLQILPLM